MFERQVQILRYPRLDTVLKIENFIRDNSGEFTKTQLWHNLPNGIMYQTYCVVFDYLLESNKIALDKEGIVVWIWNPEGVKKALARGVRVR